MLLPRLNKSVFLCLHLSLSVKPYSVSPLLFSFLLLSFYISSSFINLFVCRGSSERVNRETALHPLPIQIQFWKTLEAKRKEAFRDRLSDLWSCHTVWPVLWRENPRTTNKKQPQQHVANFEFSLSLSLSLFSLLFHYFSTHTLSSSL